MADAVSSSALNESIVVYVSETGSKTYENASGSEYTSRYIKGVKPDGSEIEYTISQSWVEAGDLLEIRFDSDGKMSIGRPSPGGGVYGTADAELQTIGTASIAVNATILDTNLGNYTATSMQRLDGVKIKSDDVLYYEASGGRVTTLILHDVTGDTSKYGVLTSAKSGESSGSYTYLIEGVSDTLTTANGTLGVQAGPAKFYGESGTISNIKNLSKTGTKVKTFASSQLTVEDKIGGYPVSADVAVYTKASGSYEISKLNDALEAFRSDKKQVSFYYDKEPEQGGCIRVIVY